MLIIVADHKVVVVVIITIGLIKYPTFSSSILFAILLLHLEGSVRAAILLQVVKVILVLNLLVLLVLILDLVLFSFYPFLFFAPFCN